MNRRREAVTAGRPNAIYMGGRLWETGLRGEIARDAPEGQANEMSPV
jgi:hypothetical protein